MTIAEKNKYIKKLLQATSQEVLASTLYSLISTRSINYANKIITCLESVQEKRKSNESNSNKCT